MERDEDGVSMSLNGLLFHAAREAPDRGVQYVGDGADSVVTYPDLVKEALRMLAGLRARGLRPQDRMVLVFEHPKDFLPGLWAAFLGGFVACPIQPNRIDLSRWVTQITQIDELLDKPLFISTKELVAELPEAPGVSIASREELDGTANVLDVHNSKPDDLALLMLTSGSTGLPKAVKLTHANLLASVSAKAERLAVSSDDITMNWIAFDHIAAIEMHLLPLSAAAGQLQVRPQSVLGDPAVFLRLISDGRVSLTFTPNFLLGQINRLPADDLTRLSPDLSSLRHIISGGEAVVPATALAFLDRLAPYGLGGHTITPAFGMTETCAGCVFSTEFSESEVDAEFASLGTPVSGLELRVVNQEGDAVSPGEIGELELRGPMVTSGYLNNVTVTREAFTADGWFRTGDRGRLINGRLRLVGRSKDSIIVNGVNYSSQELESVLGKLDGVRESCVAAFPTRPPGSDTEQVAVAFSPTNGLEDDSEIFRLLVGVRNSAILHWGFRPAAILPLPEDEFPRTSLGKIRRTLLRERLEGGYFHHRQRWVADMTRQHLGGYRPPEGEAETRLAEIYAELFTMDSSEVSATDSFFDLGGTSLDILRLKNAVQRRFGTSLPVELLLRAPTVRALAARLSDTAGGTDETYDPLVPLQLTGERIPLFCVHPGLGEVLVFVNLAKYFVNERPFYALRARGFGEHETHFRSFEEMVDCYVRAIRSAQPTGPYAIAGYSYGGVVAFEIAKRLQEQGDEVGFIGIINIPPHIRDRMNEIDIAEGAVNLAFFLSLVTKDQAARLPEWFRSQAMTRDEQFRYLIDNAPKRRLVELDLDLPRFIAWVELAQSMVELGRAYEPSGRLPAVNVFYCNPLRGTKEDWLKNQLMVWEDYTTGDNRYVEVDGEHYTLMGPAHVDSFQATLRAELDRALGGR